MTTEARKEARTANRRLAKVAVQFSASTFVVKIATFAKRQTVMCKLMYKQTFAKYKMLIPLLILIGLSTLTLLKGFSGQIEVNGSYYDFVLSIKNYAAFTALIINIIIFSFFRKYFKYTFSITILLGLFSLINYNSTDTKWILRLGSLEVGFQPTSFLIGLLTIGLNLKLIKSFLDSLNDEKSERNLIDNQRIFDEHVDKFKDIYANYSTEDLQNIISNNRHVDSALEAARQIINNRDLGSI
jgi:hypothetical protein